MLEKLSKKGLFKEKQKTITRHFSVQVCERGRPGKITLCSLLGGTLSFGTFREKRRETLRWNGEHSKELYLVSISSLRGLCRMHNNPCLLGCPCTPPLSSPHT